jgi:hypothetical protein
MRKEKTMAKYKITIYWKKSSIDNASFRNPWVERFVDDYEIDRDLRYLYINRIRTGMPVGMFNLDDMLGYEVKEEEET